MLTDVHSSTHEAAPCFGCDAPVPIGPDLCTSCLQKIRQSELADTLRALADEIEREACR
jgi:hypothetical protein